jgi:hypothetical protein
MTTSAPQETGGQASLDLQWTSSAAGSPANPSAPPAARQASQTNGGGGHGWRMWYAQYDPATSSWRTLQPSFETLTPSGGSSVTFTGSGSMRSGRLSPRAPLVPHTDDDACTSWRTPVARDFKGYTKREGESICNQLRAMYGGSGRPNPRWLEWLMGFPRRLVRHAIHALGNAVVPQVAEHIGRIVIAYEGRAAA